MKLSFGYSPCPNDTLAFYALAHGKIDLRGYEFSISLEDVETLNQKALLGTYDITKLSAAALGNLRGRYTLLRSGGAMGRGCGPLLVARPGVSLSDLIRKPVAVPGMLTTAAALMGLFAPETRRIPIPFDAIMPGLCREEYDLGVIIHEGRFTYESHGLICLKDLGAWWEETTGMPIPLGCIAAQSDLPASVIQDVGDIIRESVVYGLSHRGEAADYIAEHAQEMEGEVIRRHIDLYVNEFTIDMGEEGKRAIRYLMTRFPSHLTGGA